MLRQANSSRIKTQDAGAACKASHSQLSLDVGRHADANASRPHTNFRRWNHCRTPALCLARSLAIYMSGSPRIRLHIPQCPLRSCRHDQHPTARRRDDGTTRSFSVYLPLVVCIIKNVICQLRAHTNTAPLERRIHSLVVGLIYWEKGTLSRYWRFSCPRHLPGIFSRCMYMYVIQNTAVSRDRTTRL